MRYFMITTTSQADFKTVNVTSIWESDFFPSTSNILEELQKSDSRIMMFSILFAMEMEKEDYDNYQN